MATYGSRAKSPTSVPAPSGHIYFTLKDADAQLPVVLFRRQAMLLRFRPEDGLHVLVRGRVSVYEQRGQMQLVAETMEPVGAGSLQLAFEQLKQRLKAEDLFSAARKRPLPAFPLAVGIVTSPTGAVIRDFLSIVARRHSGLSVLIFPVAVQGDQAPAEIEAALVALNASGLVDVIVLARGGGSLEDLAAFNTERVARAIAASRLPVVSAIGHETDFTIADFAADLRAPTPSAAAELITEAQHKIAEHHGRPGPPPGARRPLPTPASSPADHAPACQPRRVAHLRAAPQFGPAPRRLFLSR
jgi:exodeoxyribonuclease VII large subunit